MERKSSQKLRWAQTPVVFRFIQPQTPVATIRTMATTVSQKRPSRIAPNTANTSQTIKRVIMIPTVVSSHSTWFCRARARPTRAHL